MIKIDEFDKLLSVIAKARELEFATITKHAEALERLNKQNVDIYNFYTKMKNENILNDEPNEFDKPDKATGGIKQETKQKTKQDSTTPTLHDTSQTTHFPLSHSPTTQQQQLLRML